YSMSIEPFNIRTITGEKEFVKFLSIIKEGSKFIFENDFFLDRSFYLPLFFASNGTVANIMKFIKLVFRLAIKKDTNIIKKQYFALIYEQAIFKKESVFPNFQNPFNVDFDTFLSWSLVSSTI